MPETLADKIGNFFHIGYTENERKRDQYDKLHDYLKSKESEVRNKIEKAESAKRAYESKSNNLPLGKIPAREFEDKRREKDDKLSSLMTQFHSSLDSITHAKNTAYQKYLEYKAKAEAEDQAAAAGK
ncbi:hypothetical protein [Bacillus sp. BP-3]|uniref:hypothetical protein n=1 Tax=Bacillus sp. BP-3 TaxID=3022773 RepID=UPI00232C458C|nr:hypothetical protein [Bacillus sp. BP-3]MDC2866672.1 hypothetical protein [Bacillus sp. BP-3]